jgi:hypothetical protein
MKGIRLKSCEEFTIAELRGVQRELYSLASMELKALYARSDGRYATYATSEEMEGHWKNVASADPRVRDAHCHEAVMWFVHHLTKEARDTIMQSLTLPKLPVEQHTVKVREENDHAGKFYDQKVTCQRCHINGIESLGAPEILPTTDKEKARRCYTNYKDLFNYTCGPCDGVAGKYWGDDDNKFFNPDPCVVVGTPADIPQEERVNPVFPTQFSVNIAAGSDRWGRTTNPAVSPKTGLPTFMNSMYGQITGSWYVDLRPDSDLWLLRHDTHYGDIHFNGTKAPFISADVSEIHAQTRKDQEGNSTGQMVSLVKGLPSWMPGGCTCVADPVGNVDMSHSRDGRSGLGEMEYLGRIKLTLSELKEPETVELDHWALWFFHVFMDVDKSVPHFGKAPKRLASAYAGTAVYSNWTLADPKIADPTVWNRGIPTSPMRVGPDHGKYCMNPQKVSMCNNISQATYPPSPQAASVLGDNQQTPWLKLHDVFLPSLSSMQKAMENHVAESILV